MKLKIASIASYLPRNRVSSLTLDNIVKGKEGGIMDATGVRYRHHISDDECVSQMGAGALKLALDRAGLQAADLDLLIFAGASFDYPVPHNSALIKARLTDDRVNFDCFDIDSTCLSFLHALDVTHLYLLSGRYKRVAIVSSEISSLALSPSDEKVYGLFGDAAVAVIVESTESTGYTPGFVNFKNFPSGVFLTMVPVGGAVNRGINSPPDDPGYNFKMEGKNLLRLISKHIDGFIADMEERSGTGINQFDKIITHQASKVGNEFFNKRFSIPPGKRVDTLEIHGNCISASIPLGLEKLLNDGYNTGGKRILLFGTGAGLTIGSLVLEFDPLN